MDKEKFLDIIQEINDYKKTLNHLDLDYGIDISCSYFCDVIQSLIESLIDIIFEEEGVDCIKWYIDDGSRANDVIPYIYISLHGTDHFIKTPEDLWDYVKNYLIRKQK